MEKLANKSAIPFYAQVKELLRAKISSGHYLSTVPLTEVVLAEEFGVSRDTVRRALVELRTDGLLVRLPGRGTFVRSASLSRRRPRRVTIGIVSNFGTHEVPTLYYLRLMNAVHISCEKQNISVKYFRPVEPVGNFIALLRAEKSLDALLLIWIDDPLLLRGIAELSIPSVLLESGEESSNCAFDVVCHSAEVACYEAVSVLLKSGHRDIALFRGDHPNVTNSQRQAGYIRALREFGIPVHGGRDYAMPFSPECAYLTMKRVLTAPPIPTAIFCTGDGLASAVILAALEHGLRIPDDISVVGFGDDGGFNSPPLSTIKIPLEQLGVEAIRVARERVRDRTAPRKKVLLPGVWTARSSHGWPPLVAPQSKISNVEHGKSMP
jgi:DNA-binding LacI/PurR family transcriptional regulator